MWKFSCTNRRSELASMLPRSFWSRPRSLSLICTVKIAFGRFVEELCVDTQLCFG